MTITRSEQLRIRVTPASKKLIEDLVAEHNHGLARADLSLVVRAMLSVAAGHLDEVKTKIRNAQEVD